MIDEKLKEARLSYKVNSPSCERDGESYVNTHCSILWGRRKRLSFVRNDLMLDKRDVTSRHYSLFFCLFVG